MVDVKVKVKVSHLARGTVKGTEEIDKVVYLKGQEFTCSEEEARGLGTSVQIIEKIPEPVKTTKAAEPVKTATQTAPVQTKK